MFVGFSNACALVHTTAWVLCGCALSFSFLLASDVRVRACVCARVCGRVSRWAAWSSSGVFLIECRVDAGLQDNAAAIALPTEPAPFVGNLDSFRNVSLTRFDTECVGGPESQENEAYRTQLSSNVDSEQYVHGTRAVVLLKAW